MTNKLVNRNLRDSQLKDIKIYCVIKKKWCKNRQKTRKISRF